MWRTEAVRVRTTLAMVATVSSVAPDTTTPSSCSDMKKGKGKKEKKRKTKKGTEKREKTQSKVESIR